MTDTSRRGDREAEQIDLARQIGGQLTDAFVAYVRGRVAFDELTFGVYDALSDLHAVASGDYELATDDDSHHHDYDEREATDEQEDLAQEPVRDERD